jgi:hypothetical protein
MFCFSCKPIVNVSSEAKRLGKNLENLAYIYLLITMLKLFLGDFDNFLNDIFTILMVILTYIQANFFMATFLIFMLIYQFFFVIVSFLLIIQDYSLGLIAIETGIQSFYIFLIFLTCIIHICLIFYSFLAYKEYKALFYEQSQLAAMNNYSN